MKPKPMAPLLLVALAVGTAANAQQEGLDLSVPANGSSQEIPAYITKDNTPPGNRITDLGATLGRVLFYDRRLSRNDSVSCSSSARLGQASGARGVRAPRAARASSMRRSTRIPTGSRFSGRRDGSHQIPAPLACATCGSRWVAARGSMHDAGFRTWWRSSSLQRNPSRCYGSRPAPARSRRARRSVST